VRERLVGLVAGAPSGADGGFPPGGGPIYGQSAQAPAGYGQPTVPDAGPAWGPPPSGPTPPGGYYPVPDGTPAPPARPRNPGPGAPAVAVTAGLALLAGGGIMALDAARVIELGDSGNAVVWAGGAAVLGLGILFAGLRGRTSGILGFFAVVALFIGGIFTVVPNGDRNLVLSRRPERRSRGRVSRSGLERRGGGWWCWPWQR
jgi:hypothetical protein